MQSLQRKVYARPASRSRQRGRCQIEALERRQFLAAHLAGSAAIYPTIQEAVNAAAPGATVTVDAGTYAEIVTINKSLVLRGAQAGVDARSNLRESGANETVLTGIDLGGSRSGSFYISAANVTLDGFVVQGNTSTASYAAGIVLAPKISGTRIVNNIVQNNVSGLYLANSSSSNAALIQHNLFRFNNNDGPNSGRAIYSDGGVSGGLLTNVTIDGNAFIRNFGGVGTTTVEAAIAFESYTAGSQSNIRITGNTFDGNGKSVLAWNMTGITITGNTSTYNKDQWSGVFRFEGNVNNATIQNNTIYNNPGAAIRIDSKAAAGDNSGFVITHNNLYRNSLVYAHEGIVVGAGQYTGTLDARYNYWGSSSGPAVAGTGTGDSLIANGNAVLFSPWLAAPEFDLQVPYFGLAPTSEAVIQAEDFDHGGEGYAYHDLDTTNSGTKYRGQQGVDIESTTDAGGGYDMSWTRAGEWAEYTVNLAQSGTYSVDFRVANAQATGGTFHLEIDGVNVTGAMTVPYTGGWQNWQMVSKTGLNLSAGQHVIRLAFDINGSSGSIGNFNYFRLTNTTPSPIPAAPTNLTANPAGATAINLSWSDNANNESGYVIERKSATAGVWQAIANLLASSTSYVDSTVAAASSYVYRVRATSAAGDSGNSNEAIATTPAAQSTTYVSDLPWISATNGWGPAERDGSNGGSAAGDGRSITLNGISYSKGIGVHAGSEIVINLGGGYSQFLSDIGIDDETGNGTVVFQVYADGLKIYDSGIMTQAGATKSVAVSVAGVQQLKLVVTDAGDGVDYDHADWANARLITGTVAAPTAPAPPSSLAALVSGTTIKLSWLDNSSNEDGFRIERSSDNVSFIQVGSVGVNVVSYSDASAVAGQTYYYRVRAFNTAGASAYSNMALASIAVTNALPAPWKHGDVGAVGMAGSASYSNGVYTVRGSGAGVGGASDSFQFAYQTLTGDGQIIARVTSVQNTDPSALAGLMIRETLSSKSREVGLFLTPSSGVRFTRRSKSGGVTSTTSAAAPTAPYWLKLVRAGSTFSAYTSADGVAWTFVGSTNVSMTTTVYIGLAVTSKNNTLLNTATFDNVTIG